MKKKLFIFLIILVVSATTLFGSMDFVTTGLSGGWSSIEEGGAFGFNFKYQYTVRANKHLYFGFGSNLDLDLIFIDSRTNVGAGIIVGPVLSIPMSMRNTLNFMVGPAFYLEDGKIRGSNYEYCGVGLGLDAFYTYYLDTTCSIGLSIGTTAYLQFTNLRSSTEYNGFNADIKGYVGITWKGGEYTTTPPEMIPPRYSHYYY